MTRTRDVCVESCVCVDSFLKLVMCVLNHVCVDSFLKLVMCVLNHMYVTVLNHVC